MRVFLNRSFRSAKKFNSEKGAAMVEMAIITPFLVLCLIGIADIGRALNTYLTLTQVAHEAARYGAAQRNGLGTTSQSQSYSVGTGYTASSGSQYEIMNRAWQLVDVQEGFDTDIDRTGLNIYSDSLTINSDYFDANPTDDGVPGRTMAEANTIKVQVKVKYRGLFNIFDQMQLGVEATAPVIQ